MNRHEVPDTHSGQSPTHNWVKDHLQKFLIREPAKLDDHEKTKLNETGLVDSRRALKFILAHRNDGRGMGGNEPVLEAYIDAFDDFLNRLETTSFDTARHGNEFGTELRHFPHGQIPDDGSNETMPETLVVASMGLNTDNQHGSAAIRTWKHNHHYGSEIIGGVIISNNLAEAGGNPGIRVEEWEFYPYTDPHWMNGRREFGNGKGYLINHWTTTQIVGSKTGVVTDRPRITLSESSFKRDKPTISSYSIDGLLGKLDESGLSPDAVRKIPLGKAASF